MIRLAGAFGCAAAMLALLAGGATPASAANCDGSLIGGNSSAWEADDSDGEFEEAWLFSNVGSDVVRDDAFDDYGEVNVDGSSYENPNELGCSYPKGKREILFPVDEIGDIAVRPQLYVSKGKSFGRQFVSLRNTTAVPVTVDFEWDGDLGSDNGTAIAATSSGDQAASEADRWATTCEDDEDDGCANTSGDDLDRDPELAHNWEGKGQKKHSADAVSLADGSGDFDVEFDDVTIGAGKTVTFLQVVSLAPTIKAANKAAKAIDTDPAKYGIFAKLSKRELKGLQNWKKPRIRRRG